MNHQQSTTQQGAQDGLQDSYEILYLVLDETDNNYWQLLESVGYSGFTPGQNSEGATPGMKNSVPNAPSKAANAEIHSGPELASPLAGTSVTSGLQKNNPLTA